MFLRGGEKFLRNSRPVCEFYVFKDLSAKCPLAYWFESLFEVIKDIFTGNPRELILIALEIPEGIIIDNTD